MIAASSDGYTLTVLRDYWAEMVACALVGNRTNVSEVHPYTKSTELPVALRPQPCSPNATSESHPRVESDSKIKPDDARSCDGGFLFGTYNKCFFESVVHEVEGPLTKLSGQYRRLHHQPSSHFACTNLYVIVVGNITKVHANR
jgi:hypothetical protein